MNPERRIIWIEKVSGFLVRIHLLVERVFHLFFPEKPIEIVSLDEMDEYFSAEWINTFREELNKT